MAENYSLLRDSIKFDPTEFCTSCIARVAVGCRSVRDNPWFVGAVANCGPEHPALGDLGPDDPADIYLRYDWVEKGFSGSFRHELSGYARVSTTEGHQVLDRQRVLEGVKAARARGRKGGRAS